ncbi:hypothetical protein ILUMI_23844 [Ignelater luminosus]|uniref:Uncharacterized protein n=1 Tax=Ignelater luminosus TaxID=2038154 RepID=A0A8K0C7B1_IGNLU|nr:hypothetical protein ILUMI_23844 [Ignelater luminosus]
MTHHHRDRLTKADVCDVLCQKFNSICFRKASKHCFYEDYVLLRNQLLLLEYAEDDPAILSKLSDISERFIRFIEDVAEPLKHTLEFVKDIHRKLMFLYDIINRHAKQVTVGFPIPDKLNSLLVRYVELEYEALQNAGKIEVEYQKDAEKRVLFLLLTILEDTKTSVEKDGMIDDMENPHAMNVLQVLTNVKVEYRSSDGFIENIMM